MGQSRTHNCNQNGSLQNNHYYNRGIDALERFEDAINDFSIYIEFNPADADGYYARGVAGGNMVTFKMPSKTYHGL